MVNTIESSSQKQLKMDHVVVSYLLCSLPDDRDLKLPESSSNISSQCNLHGFKSQAILVCRVGLCIVEGKS